MTFEELMRLEDELNIYHLAKLIESCDKVDDRPPQVMAQHSKTYLIKLEKALDMHKRIYGQERNEWLLLRLLKHALK